MKHLFLFLLSLLLLSACAGPQPVSQAVRPDQLDFPPLQFSFPEISQQQLSNGIRLYLKEDHELPLVEFTLMVRGGSIYDPPEVTGLSQLFAATLETGGCGEVAPAALEAELEAMAAKLSVTSSTYGYQIDLSLHQRDLDRGVAILADLLRHPQFDSERLELARSQMLEAIRRKNDDPGAIAGRLLAEAVYDEHPFGRTARRAVVEQISREDLLQLHEYYFQPDNLWLSVSGATTQSELLHLLDKYFADWKTQSSIALNLPPLPPAPEGRVVVADKKISQTSILLGHLGVNKDNPDVYALRVANYILGGGGFNSRMMREVRSNRGLAYSVYSYFQVGRILPELFIAGSETKTETTLKVVILMRQLLKQLIAEPVSEQELQLAKQSLINSFVFAFTDSHSVVSRKLRLDYYAYPSDYMETYQQKISAVTIADVQRVAREYLHPEKLQIILVGDSDEFLPQTDELGLPVEVVDLTNEQ